MERIYTLIDKLYQQRQHGSHPAQLLITIQLLQSELLKLQNKNGSLGSSKVAVTLPVNLNFSDGETINEVSDIPQSGPLVEAKANNFIKEAEKIIPPPVKAPTYEEITYGLQKQFVEEKAPEEKPLPKITKQVLNPAFDTEVESPTLLQHQNRKELHEMIAEPKESLNDRLKQDKTEVVNVLKESPIKDLRKGIGINDRFTFVSELFRGDDAMYERSIKTINSFSVLSEAEYWMNRELKFKLGWNDNKEIVQHFYQLVRRRFA